MVTISDVAKRAGVSAASVSRHMSGGTVGGADRIAAAIRSCATVPTSPLVACAPAGTGVSG